MSGNGLNRQSVSTENQAIASCTPTRSWWQALILLTWPTVVIVFVVNGLPAIRSSLVALSRWTTDHRSPLPHAEPVGLFATSSAPSITIHGLGGEPDILGAPLCGIGRMHSSNASWLGESATGVGVQEAVEPTKFYRADNRIMGRPWD